MKETQLSEVLATIGFFTTSLEVYELETKPNDIVSAVDVETFILIELY